MRQAIVTLKKGEGRLLKSGGAWIFDNEIDSIMGEFENGDIVIVHDFDGYGMGRGFINMNSKIRIRMMTRKQDQEIDHSGNAGERCVGIPEKDSRYIKLPCDFRGSGFSSRTGD